MNARRIAVLTAAALALAACAEGRNPGFQGWVEADLIFVSPDEYGRVETLSVREGDTRREGRAAVHRRSRFAGDRRRDGQGDARQRRGQAFERAQALLKTATGTQKAFDDAEAALRTARGAAVVGADAADAPQGHEPGHRQRAADLLPARRDWCRPAGRWLSLLPPGNIKVRFFVPETELPRISLGEPVSIHCDGCKAEVPAQVTFISRSSEFTPPVIYSLDERSKLVFLIEARTETPAELRVGQPVDVRLGEASDGGGK